jgi:hypothetical protein
MKLSTYFEDTTLVAPLWLLRGAVASPRRAETLCTQTMHLDTHRPRA